MLSSPAAQNAHRSFFYTFSESIEKQNSLGLWEPNLGRRSTARIDINRFAGVHRSCSTRFGTAFLLPRAKSIRIAVRAREDDRYRPPRALIRPALPMIWRCRIVFAQTLRDRTSRAILGLTFGIGKSLRYSEIAGTEGDSPSLSRARTRIGRAR